MGMFIYADQCLQSRSSGEGRRPPGKGGRIAARGAAGAAAAAGAGGAADSRAGAAAGGPVCQAARCILLGDNEAI